MTDEELKEITTRQAKARHSHSEATTLLVINDVPALLAEIERMRAENEQLQADLAATLMMTGPELAAARDRMLAG